jgi:hypothetical protein
MKLKVSEFYTQAPQMLVNILGDIVHWCAFEGGDFQLTLLGRGGKTDRVLLNARF